MAVGGIVELFYGVRAEQVPLEDIAKPLTAEEAEQMPEREREGRRRYRPGLGLAYPYYSPGMVGTAVRRPTAAAELQREVEAIGGGRGRPGLARRARADCRGASLGTRAVPSRPVRGRGHRPDPPQRAGAVRSP